MAHQPHATLFSVLVPLTGKNTGIWCVCVIIFVLRGESSVVLARLSEKKSSQTISEKEKQF